MAQIPAAQVDAYLRACTQGEGNLVKGLVHTLQLGGVPVFIAGQPRQTAADAEHTADACHIFGVKRGYIQLFEPLTIVEHKVHDGDA